MQNRYTGDIGDFAKYGLLRHLAGDDDPVFRLGVVWYLTLDEWHTGDGGHVGYLLPGNEQPYIDCDQELYQQLRTLVMAGTRSVAAVRAHRVLPPGTVCYESLLAPAGIGRRRLAEMRPEWQEQALIATAPCNLVFLDPDNGVPIDTGAPGVKHALFSEIRDYRAREQSVVVYHHLTRSGTHAEQMKRLAERLQEEIPGPEPIVLRAGRGSGRAFVILPSDEHELSLHERVDALLASPWVALFERGGRRSVDGVAAPRTVRTGEQVHT